MQHCKCLVAQSEEGLLHLQWVERNADSSITAQQPELDTIVFPGETTFKRVGGIDIMHHFLN